MLPHSPFGLPSRGQKILVIKLPIFSYLRLFYQAALNKLLTNLDKSCVKCPKIGLIHSENEKSPEFLRENV